jgi:2-polyprenyl-3-methyl-5-hydroxy-6-metoxy-1,4-benzoquinol methylase
VEARAAKLMARTDRPPSPERILEALIAYQRTAVLKAAIELDVFTVIGEGADDLGAISRRLHASEKGVRALANYLVAAELLTRSGARYALTPESARYLDRRSPDYLGGTSSFYDAPAIVEGFAAAAEAVRRGGSGAGGTDSMAPSHPIWIEYARAMAPLFARPAEALADLILRQVPHPTRVLDIAAGHGLFGIALARRVPTVVATALDWPEVLTVAEAHALDARVGDRFRTIHGSAFDAPLGTGWDVVVLANFLHHFDAATCDGLLRRVRESMSAGGVVALVEFIPNEDRVSPPAVAQFGMTMLATTPHGDVYTFSELSAMLERAGFVGAQLHPLPHTPQRAVLARR